jgi:prolyl-tRNA editing enzyme YbaK/EbsC (Cys-tRNA(Pro) deacylase)
MTDLSSSAQRVQDALKEKGLDCRVVELPASTRTAVEAAASIGTTVAQIVKSLVFRGQHSSTAILVLVSGVNRVNEARLAELAGEAVGKADADFVRQQTGFVIGGVPPLGHTHLLKTFIDADLLQYSEVWAAAGTPHAVFCILPADLLIASGGQVVRVT